MIFGMRFMYLVFFVDKLYMNGNIFDVCEKLFEDFIFFELYIVCILFLFLFVKLFVKMCKLIIFFFFDIKWFDKCLFLKIIVWYVISVLDFGIIGFMILFLYLCKVFNLDFFSKNFFIILLIINNCGFFGLLYVLINFMFCSIIIL